MLRIPYTIEMQKQDRLHGDAKEDRDIMAKLHSSIIEEAKNLGFKGTTESELFTLSGDDEFLTTVFKSLEEQELVSLGHVKPRTTGTCKGLIMYLNECMEKDHHEDNG